MTLRAGRGALHRMTGLAGLLLAACATPDDGEEVELSAGTAAPLVESVELHRTSVAASAILPYSPAFLSQRSGAAPARPSGLPQPRALSVDAARMVSLRAAGAARDPEERVILFERLPGKHPTPQAVMLRGDEFAGLGVLFSGASWASSCALGAQAAPVWAGRECQTDVGHLSSAGAIGKAHQSIPVRVRFTRPVRSLKLVLAGAAGAYRMTAYNRKGTFLGQVAAPAYYDGAPRTVHFTREAAEIDRIELGHESDVVVLRELRFRY